MKALLQTRLIHWKKQLISLLFWLLLPIIATILVIYFTQTVQEDIKVPVGIVLEDDSLLASDLYDKIEATPLIRIYDLTKVAALQKLKKHELDSVFIIRKGYETSIRKNSRNQLILGYQSNLSFAYTPIKEMIVSYAIEDAGRSKAAYAVQDLSRQYGQENKWTWDEIVAKSSAYQTDKGLIHTNFTFANADPITEDPQLTLLKTWSVWALLALLSTLLLFDWLIKERSPGIISRFAFIRIPFKRYLLINTAIYFILFLFVDLLTIVLFYLFLDEPIQLALFIHIFFYHLLLTTGAFLLALLFKNTYVYYTVSFVITLLLTILSGAIIQIEGITDSIINPLSPFLLEKLSNPWLFACILFIGIWYMRKEQSNA